MQNLVLHVFNILSYSVFGGNVVSMDCERRLGRPLAVSGDALVAEGAGRNKSSRVPFGSGAVGSAPMVTCRSTFCVKVVFSLTPPVAGSTSNRGGARMVSSNMGLTQGLDSPPAPTVSMNRNLFTTNRCPQYVAVASRQSRWMGASSTSLVLKQFSGNRASVV